MKQILMRLFSFSLKAIASAWIFGIFNCFAADFNDQSREYTDDPVKFFGHRYPSVAQGYEEMYDRFLNGKLIYRPDPGSDEGKVELRIADLANPLDGTFDLSRCGDAGDYLSISTGYRKGKRPENVRKVEIWLAPRFLIENELNTTAKHFQPIFGTWKETAQVGIFWTWGNWDNLSWYDYLTTQNDEDLSKNNLYEKWREQRGKRVGAGRACGTAWRWASENFMYVCKPNA